MTHLEDFIKAVEYKITGGSEYTWPCFGDNARYLDCADNEGVNGTYSISAVFDSQTQQVYIIEAWDYKNDREYRWIDPDYVNEHNAYSKKMKVDIRESLDGRNYIDLELLDDILEKINALVNGLEYDERIKVPVNLSDDTLYDLMKLAHEEDITFNQLVNNLLQQAIDNEELLKEWK